MTQPTAEDGFKFWREEVEGLERPEKEIPYIPVIGLVGVYAAFTIDRQTLNSYSWRQTVLQNSDAIEGFRSSLTNSFKDQVDDPFELPLDLLVPEDGAAAQLRCAHESLLDGMPEGLSVISETEWFLAQQLGYARHDFGVMLEPLRLIDGGVQALTNNYPLTAAFIGENT